MARFLFVVPPFAGHVNPTISVGRELRRRGHEVAWAGLPGGVDRLLPDDVCFLPTGSPSDVERLLQTGERAHDLRFAAAFKFLWERVLLPMGSAMLDGVDAAVESWRPDVLLSDQQALAGGAVAVRHGLPWATSATTSAELVDPLQAIPRAADWVGEQLAAFAASAGLPAAVTDPGAGTGAGVPDLRFSPHLVLVFSTERLVDAQRCFPAHYAFVGPSLSDRPQREPFPWDWFDPALPHVLVSLGTVNTEAGAHFYAAAAKALADEPVQAVFVAPPPLVDVPADNVLVQPRVPQLSLLPHLDAVVCHAGHNTVCEALAHGLPLVVAPIRDDQPVIADQVVRAGAGVRVRFGRVVPQTLRQAVRQVLDDPTFRQAAGAVRDSFQAAGGAPAAASRLETLACAGAPAPPVSPASPASSR
jgi:MGT family glycosyltransferase